MGLKKTKWYEWNGRQTDRNRQRIRADKQAKNGHKLVKKRERDRENVCVNS